MGQDKKNPIVVNDVEYNLDNMSDQQRIMINHIVDLDRKLSSARFNVQQLEVGREAFVNMLTKSLEQPTEKAA
jgi:hypothetical protein